MHRGGFTLIEVLVVVAVIALLIAILIPSLSASRAVARKTVCKSLLRQYQIASDMYIMEYQGMMMDSYNHLDPKVGIPKYLGHNGKMPQEPARCPDDKSTAELGRLGKFPKYNNVAVSIGCNENTMSASGRMTRFGPTPFWFKRDCLKGLAWKMMTWADWQDNITSERDTTTGEPLRTIVKPVDGAIGNLVFRHAGVSNAAWLDGHVGEIKPKTGLPVDEPRIALLSNGHDLTPDSNWGITGSIGQLAKCYYPFGPAKDFETACKGNWPTLTFH